MALSPARKPKSRPKSPLNAIALVIALGVGTSVLVNNSDRLPFAQLAGLRPAVVKLLPGLQSVWLLTKTYTVNGRAWKLASMTPVTDFDEAELVPVVQIGHHRVVANRARGVARLGDNPHAFDRLYLELEPHVYAALKWRDIP